MALDIYGMIAGLGPAFTNAYDQAQTQYYGQQAADLYAKKLDAAPAATSGITALAAPAPAASTAGPAKLPSFIQQSLQDASDQTGIGLPYLSKLAQVESSGNPNARNPSGASGLMQFMPGTAKRYGLTDPFDPAASAVAAGRLAQDNAATLRQRLGRDPTDGEVYLAHQQGAGGASALLANPNANAVDALSAAYGGDRAKAARAIVANGGSTDMTAGQFASRWTSKFAGSPMAVSGASGAQVAAAPMPDVPPVPPRRPASLGVQVASADPNFAPQMPAAASMSPSDILVAQARARSGQAPDEGDDGESDAGAIGVSGGADAIPSGPAGTGVPVRTAQATLIPGQVVYPGQAPAAGPASAPGVASGLAALPPGQRDQLRQMLANPVTRGHAMQLIDKLSAPDEFDVREVGGRLYRINKRTGQAGLVPGVGDNVERFNNNGTEYIRDKITGETKVLIPSSKDETKDPEAVRKLTMARQNWKEFGLPDPRDPSNGGWWKSFAAKTLGGATAGVGGDGPKVLPAGGALVGPDGRELYRNGGSGSNMDDDTVDFLARRVVAGDSRALIGLGRGAQGAENLGKIQTRVQQLANAQGLDASDLLHNSAVAAGMNAAERTGQTQEAKMGAAGFEANNMIDIALATSAKVPRTNFVPVNKALQAWQTNTGDPQIRAFGATVNSLVNSYSRAINPTGVGTVSDKEHARELLSTADSPEAFQAVTDIMRQEIEAAHRSPSQAAQYREQQRQLRKTQAPSGGSDPRATPREGATATNPTTGQKLQLKGGQWVPLTGPQS